MPSETESLAAQLVHALSDAPDGRPMQWRKIEQLDFATADAMEFAAARGWIKIESPSSVIAETTSRKNARRQRSRPASMATLASLLGSGAPSGAKVQKLRA